MFGVVVHLDGVEESFFTDEKGAYKIRGLAPGVQKLTFFQPGFGKEEFIIDPKNGVHKLNVQLKPLSQDLTAVTVTGDADEKMR